MMTDTDEGRLKEQECDECGKFVAKIWRVYQGHRYCSTCYARLFKRRICPSCGNFARLLKNKPDAVCRRCETNKPCVRCGKSDYEVGKITPYGPVCKVCLPYFQEPRACGLCGKWSTYLTRVKRLNIDIPVCPRCARQDHRTCQACHRYRLLAEAPDGRMLCKVCLEKGNVLCPKCDETMPAGYGWQCEGCYWKGLLEKRIEMDCAVFTSLQMATYFKAFGQWLGRKVGEQKAASTIHRYLSFFIEIEQQWKTIPKYDALLAHFGTLRLRRALLPMSWMEGSEFIVPNAIAREEDSNRRRIMVILDRFPMESQERTLLTGYHKLMIESLEAEKTTICSIRLALSPAAALLLKAREMKCIPPNQKVLDAYLETTPGQRAALSGFVCYLRDTHGVRITLPKPNKEKAQQNRKKKLEAEMLMLMQEGGNSEEFNRRWLSVALAYFHGLPKKTGKVLRDEQVVVSENEGITVTWNEQIYWIPVVDVSPSQLTQHSAYQSEFRQ